MIPLLAKQKLMDWGGSRQRRGWNIPPLSSFDDGSGDTVWAFGYDLVPIIVDSEDVFSGSTIPNSTAGSAAGDTALLWDVNHIGMMTFAPHKWVFVTFSGQRPNSVKNMWISTDPIYFSDPYDYSNVNFLDSSLPNNTQVLALWDLFDMNDFPILQCLTSNMNLRDSRPWPEGVNLNTYANSDAQWYQTPQDYAWNLQGIDNFTKLGNPGGEHNTYTLDSTYWGGGVGRWHILTTKADGLGRRPGTLTPYYNCADVFGHWWADGPGWNGSTPYDYFEQWQPMSVDHYGSEYNNYGNFHWDDENLEFDDSGMNAEVDSFTEANEEFCVMRSGSIDSYFAGSNPGWYTRPHWNQKEWIKLRFVLPTVAEPTSISNATMKVRMRARISIGFNWDQLINNEGQFADTYLFIAACAGEQSRDTTKWATVGDYIPYGYETGYQSDPGIGLNTLTHSLQELYDMRDNNGYVWLDNTVSDEFPDEIIAGQMNFNQSWFNNWTSEPNEKKTIQMTAYFVSTGALELDIPLHFRVHNFYVEYELGATNLDENEFYIDNYKGRLDDGGNLIENPANIVSDLVSRELNYDGAIASVDISQAASVCTGWKMAFSQKDKIDSKALINELCSNTPIFPKIKSMNSFGLYAIKNSYSNSDVHHFIGGEDVLKSKFDLTKVDDIKTIVDVKFDYDHTTRSLQNSTGWFSCKDFLGDGDLGFIDQDGNEGYRLGYYNLGSTRDIAGTPYRDEEDTTLIFDAKYITDRATAEKLQKFLCMWYCNQHIKVKLDLPLKFLNIEVADIFKIDELIGGQKAFGFDYTKSFILNGQTAYPYFLVTRVKKSLKKVSISGLMLHSLDQRFDANLGDVSRRGTEIMTANPPDDLDLEMVTDFVGNKTAKFTMSQIQSMDINGSGGVSHRDIAFWDEFLAGMTEE